ncbi:MAG: hypothetical protein IPP48_06610 [Chitinophagaceae bacterium]|nr:hypothetical protein [Chitinophagaceae bacterium]
MKDVNLELTKMMKGAFFTAYLNKWLGVRLAVDYTYLEGRDNIITTTGIDELYRKQRNLDFRTNIWEAYAAIEVFPTMIFYKNEEGFEPKLRPYILAGVGAFKFNPQGSLSDANGNKTWYNLQPLRLEGQGMAEYPYSKPYKLTQLNIPLGAGIKFYASDRINLSTEVLYRKTFTDYIDDVSQKYIDPSKFSKYLSAQEATIAYQLSDKSIPIIFPGQARFPAGTQRGDVKDGDTYFSAVLKVGIRLGPIYESAFAKRAAKQTKCPSLY